MDLIQEFFKRDLSEAEQEALAKLLQESPDAAVKYERLLEQNYLATGLPQPTLPKALQSMPHVGGGGLAAGLTKLLIIGLIAAGFALWKYWPPSKVENPAPIQRPVMRPTNPEVKRPAPIQPEAAGPTQEGQELSVLVKTPQRSLVTVRVLNAQGREVRALYAGFVDPGQWAFQWDGLLENGEPASAGNYVIDVQSGPAHLTKAIQIKLQPASH